MKEIYFEGKVVGHVVNEAYKVVKKPEHFMRMFQGFGISERVIKQLDEQGVLMVEMLYKGLKGDVIYLFTLRQFKESNKLFTFNEGDIQRFVSYRDAVEEVKL